MELVWNWLALPGLLVGPIEVALAVTVHLARPGVVQNTRFAIAFLLHGLTVFSFAARLLLVDPADGYAILFLFMPLAIASSAALLLFLGTLSTPLARPLQHPAARVILPAIAALFIVGLFVRPEMYVPSIRPFPHTTGFEFANGPWWNAWGVAYAVALLYGFVCLVDAWRRARPGIARQRAGTFAIGLGTLGLVDGLASLYLIRAGDLDTLLPTLLNFLARSIGSLVLAASMAYGILRFQLLEIDLRIKRGIRGGALAGAFFAVFLVATEGAQLIFEDRVGPFIGVVAAALLAFALHPLQRLADRVADTAMPRVTHTPQYLEYRRMEIYRETFEGLLADGELSVKERATLERLRTKLGVARADADALETDIRGAVAG